MSKKGLVLYLVILVLVILFLWQWISKGALANQVFQLQKESNNLHLLSGIGTLVSTHIHADVKVYINGNAMDFSQRKYQLASSFIHFEDGLGDVVHVHATGMTIGHLFKSLGGDINNNCITIDRQTYCNENGKTLKLYLNGQKNNEFSSRIIKDLDKYLITYGSEDDAAIQKQLSSVTNLAAKYSMNK